MPQRLVAALMPEISRAARMREYVVDQLPMRSQARAPLTSPGAPRDFVRRFVEATISAVPSVEPLDHFAGQPETWPLETAPAEVGHKKWEKHGLALPATEHYNETERTPECYPRGATGACLPGFLVLGPQKVGTSSLRAFMNHHPQLRLNEAKELLHWGPRGGPNSGLFNCSAPYADTYLDAFVRVTPEEGRMTGDFSATDAPCVCCAEAVHALMPRVKLIVIMRGPAERAQSRYREQFTYVRAKATGELPADQGLGCDAGCLHGSFSNYVRRRLPMLDACLRDSSTVVARARCAEMDQILGWSLYGAMVDHWLELFNIDQLMLIKSTALEARPLVTLRAIEGHLGLAPATYDPKFLQSEYNSHADYGWHSCHGPSCHVARAVGCDAECEAAATLGEVESRCLHQFYEMSAGAFSPASRFFASNADTCAGTACARAPWRQPFARVDIPACLGLGVA